MILCSPRWTTADAGGAVTYCVDTSNVSGINPLLSPSVIEAEIDAASALIESIADINLVKVPLGDPCDIEVKFDIDDGAGGRIAFAIQPASGIDMGGCGIPCGNIQWDIDDLANAAVDDFYNVYLHELIHAIGVAHAPTSGGQNVMESGYAFGTPRWTELGAWEAAEVLCRYPLELECSFSASPAAYSPTGTVTSPDTFDADYATNTSLILSPGLYHPTSQISGNVSLYGQDGAIIDGSLLPPNTTAIGVYDDGLTIANLTIRNSPRSGIYIEDSVGVNILNNIIHDVQETGIYVANGDGVTVSGNEIYNWAMSNEGGVSTTGGWAAGINVTSLIGNFTENFSVTGNFVHNGWGEGILVDEVDMGVVSGNIVGDAYSVGIYLVAALNTTILNNYIYADSPFYYRSGLPSHGILISNEADGNVNKGPTSNITIDGNEMVGVRSLIAWWDDPENIGPFNTYSNVTVSGSVAQLFDSTGYCAPSLSPVQAASLYTITCETVTTRGYDTSIFPTNTVIISGNTDVEIQQAIDNMLGNPAVIQLPSGIYNIDTTVQMAHGIHLVGDGNVMLIATGAIEDIIRAQHNVNVGVHDIELSGNSISDRGFFAWYCEQVYVTSCLAYQHNKSGIQCRYVDTLTLAGNECLSNTLHGIVSKDCQASDCLAEYTAGYQGVGAMNTTNALIAENDLHNNGDYGLDWHGYDTEIACNAFASNTTGGAKTQDVNGLWFHHNTFSGNGSLYYRISQASAGLPLPGSIAPNVIWANDFTGEVGAIIRYDDTQNTHLVCNLYAPDAAIDIDPSADVRIVPGSDDIAYATGIYTLDTTYEYLKEPLMATVCDTAVWTVTSQSCSIQITSATVTPSSGPAPLTVAYQVVASSTSVSGALSYEWNFGDGAQSFAQSGNYTYSGDGGYLPTVTVSGTDASGGVCQDTFVLPSVTVGAGATKYRIVDPACGCRGGAVNRPPTIPLIGNQIGVVGQATSLSINPTDPEGDTFDCVWTGLPPGISATLGDPSGTPTTTGTYITTVTCTDEHGAESSRSFTWTINATASAFWYIDSSNANSGDGTQANPWNEMDQFDPAAVDASAFKEVFVAEGDYFTTLTVAGTVQKFTATGLVRQIGPRPTQLPESGLTGQTLYPDTGQPAIDVLNAQSTIIDGVQWGGWVLSKWQSDAIRYGNNTNNVTVQYLEIYDNGYVTERASWDCPRNVCGTPLCTYDDVPRSYTGGAGIRINGTNNVIQFNLIHDNGQDAIQNRHLAVINNLTVQNNWLYNGRQNTQQSGVGGPLQGAGFESFNYATHTDGLQIYNGSAGNISLLRNVIGPGFSNGVILGDATVEVDGVTIRDSIFYNAADNGILGNAANDNWVIATTTVFGRQTKNNHIQGGSGSNSWTLSDVLVNGQSNYGCTLINFSGVGGVSITNCIADDDVILGSGAAPFSQTPLSPPNVGFTLFDPYFDLSHSTGAPAGTVADLLNVTLGASGFDSEGRIAVS